MKSLLSVWLGFLAVAALAAETAPPLRNLNGLNGPVKSGDVVFSLLPKSFQQNPTLEMTVNTEFTDYGRLLRAATPEQPVYYLPLPAGYKQLGGSMGGEHPPPQADLERAMKKALAVNGYLPAEPKGPLPSLVVIYYWGSHNALDRETRRNFPELAAKYKLERAILVGGKKYATEEGRVMEFGETILDRDAQQEFLRDQISEDLYYVVASAYDYQSVAHNQRNLAWRTSMTVNAIGVSMGESLSPLIATAGPFFGHETNAPQIDVRKFPRSGKVEVGTPTVVEDKKTKP